MVLRLLEKAISGGDVNCKTNRAPGFDTSSLLLYLLLHKRGNPIQAHAPLWGWRVWVQVQVYVFLHVRWWLGTWWVTCLRSLLFPHHPSTRGRNNDELETLEPSNFTNNQLFKTVMTAFYAAVCGFERLCTTCQWEWEFEVYEWGWQDKNMKVKGRPGKSEDEGSLYKSVHCSILKCQGSTITWVLVFDTLIEVLSHLTITFLEYVYNVYV